MEGIISPITILLAPSWKLAQQSEAHVTIEAEYGEKVWEGSLFTAAHHQAEGIYSSAESPSPCNNGGIPSLRPDGGIIGISHLDLDTIGGCARAMGQTELMLDHPGFWDLAEFVDLHGPHRVDPEEWPEDALNALYAYWAYSKAQGRGSAAKSVSNVTMRVNAHINALKQILIWKDPDLLAAGWTFRSEERTLNRDSFVETSEGNGLLVILRTGPAFVNHLYTTPGGVIADAVVNFSTRTGAVTASLAVPMKGVSCRKVMQLLFGPEAGGHAGIAGSPRESRMRMIDALTVVKTLTSK